MEVPGGRYAVFRHIGDYSLLHKFYRTIYEEWFPESKYRPQSTFSFEMYMNRPASTLRTELITDIYIPVIKKEIINYQPSKNNVLWEKFQKSCY